MPLDTNIDTTYEDDATDPSVQKHQQDHDTVHTYVNVHDGDFNAAHGSDHDARDHSTALSTAAASDLSDVDLTGIAAGAVLYYDGTNIVNLGIGTADQVLTVNSGATAPEWSNGASPEGFRAHRSTAQTLSAGTWTTVVFDTEDRDDGADYDPATGEWTVPETGWYIVGGSVQFAATSDGDRVATAIYANGIRIARLPLVAQGAAAIAVMSGSMPTHLTAGDVVTLRAFRDSAGDVSAGSDATFFTAISQ